MSGSKWGIILGEWGVVEEIFSVGGVGGVEWGWVHCLIMLVIYMPQVLMSRFKSE